MRTNGAPSGLKLLPATGKQPRDRHEHNCAECCSSETVYESVAQNAELRENPTPEHRAHQSEQDICNAAESPPARNFSGKPSCNQADHDPSDEGAWHSEEE